MSGKIRKLTLGQKRQRQKERLMKEDKLVLIRRIERLQAVNRQHLKWALQRFPQQERLEGEWREEKDRLEKRVRHLTELLLRGDSE